MDDPGLAKLPTENQILLRLSGAREQLAILRESLRAHRPALAEAAAAAVVDQLLKALTAALHGFNLLLPQPLPADRVSWRNLRARFVAVAVDSAIVNLLEESLRPRTGWLWWLDRKEHASAFAPLLQIDAETGSAAIWRDPMDPTLGFEELPPTEYLGHVLDRVEALTRDIARLARRDAEVFRHAARRQPGRML
ncbi:MAG: hypothetical protein NZL87_00305 [Thermomicrobium sp.]|nr:hypothetical protein [Thermomicrobium sp.]MDW7982277.1 hypothetical protein [Thermomicrobium sp.]